VACTCGSSDKDSGCGAPLHLDEGGALSSGSGGTPGFGGVTGYDAALDATISVGGCNTDGGLQYDASNGKCVPEKCVFGLADCNASFADGCEVGLAADLQHCGSCANACDVSCSYGSCFDPEVVAAESAEITTFTVTSDGIYYATRHPCCRLMFKADTGLAVPLLPGSSRDATAIAVSGKQIFFSAEGESFVWVVRVGPAGTSLETLKTTLAPVAIAVDPTWVYYAATDFVPRALLYRVARDGSSEELILDRPGEARALVLSGTTLYMASSSPGRIIGVDTATWSETELASDAFHAERIAVSEGHVYLADQAGQRLLRVPELGGTLETIATLSERPYDVVHAGGKLWYTTDDPAWLRQFLPAGDVQLAGLLRPFTPIAFDGQALYWSSPGVGILRLKP
jgi:hypothetical protein